MLERIKKELLLEAKPGVFHKFIAAKLKETTGFNSNIIKRKDACYSISRHMNKDCADKFLKEMEGYGLVKIKDKQNIEILD